MTRPSRDEREGVIINTYAGVNKTLIQQGAAFQSRPEFKLWHRAFTKALDPDAPTTIGTTKFSDDITKYRRLLTAQTSAAKLPRLVYCANLPSSFNHFASQRYFQLVNLLSESAKSGVAQDLGIHFWTTTISISADMLCGQRSADDVTRLVADVNMKAFRQWRLATPVHDYIPRCYRRTCRARSGIPKLFRSPPSWSFLLAGFNLRGGDPREGIPGDRGSLRWRTPDPLDTDRVEYIKALGMKAGRYFMSIRLGSPRETHEDVVVDGVFIPKGVLINRGPQRYDFTEEFVPERSMDGHYGRTDVKQPKVGVPHLNHSAGRRVCMGVAVMRPAPWLPPAARRGRSKPRGPLTRRPGLCVRSALPLAAEITLTARDPNAIPR
ncbi:cytochrome P450 [Mycena vulgaris]|nr:cytochrome P450 [Mycena vulgaris]